jgi:hydroxypyruvate reductase
MPLCNDYLASLRCDASEIFHAALKSVHAGTAVENACRIENGRLRVHSHAIDLTRVRRIYVVGAGKASADMAEGLEKLLKDRITAGAVTVKYGHTRPLEKIRLAEAGHPVPDSSGLEGAGRIMKTVDQAEASDLVVCLLSGGGSALLPYPAEPLTLVDKQAAIRALMDCGAEIHEINAVRKHMSAVKGGRLAARAWPAAVLTLIVSDVVGDDLDVIASGPTVGDPSTFADCLQTISAYGLKEKLPRPVVEHMEKGAAGRIPETPKPGDRLFERTQNHIIAAGRTALQQAKAAARAMGYNALILSSMITGDTRAAARLHASIASEVRHSGNPVQAPACLLSGGETTVVVSGGGKGGRNQEFALSSAVSIAGEEGIVVLSGGTDGTDGPTDAAGAVVDSASVQKARRLGLSPSQYLEANDSYNFFRQTGELLMTGPTGTNVMDLRVILVGKKDSRT